MAASSTPASKSPKETLTAVIGRCMEAIYPFATMSRSCPSSWYSSPWSVSFSTCARSTVSAAGEPKKANRISGTSSFALLSLCVDVWPLRPSSWLVSLLTVTFLSLITSLFFAHNSHFNAAYYFSLGCSYWYCQMITVINDDFRFLIVSLHLILVGCFPESFTNFLIEAKDDSSWNCYSNVGPFGFFPGSSKKVRNFCVHVTILFVDHNILSSFISLMALCVTSLAYLILDN